MKKVIIALILLSLMISLGAGRLPMKGDNVSISLIDDIMVIAYYGIINDTDDHLIVLDFDKVWLKGGDGPYKVPIETLAFSKANIKRMNWN